MSEALEKIKAGKSLRSITLGVIFIVVLDNLRDLENPIERVQNPV